MPAISPLPTSLSLEKEARKTAHALTASKLPYGFLVAGARNLLATGTPARDSAVEAEARRLQRQQKARCDAHIARSRRSQRTEEDQCP